MKVPPAEKSDSSSSWLREFREREAARNSAEAGFLGAPARVVAEFSQKALRTNYAAIQEQVPGLAILPMIKANAYGHGAGWAGRALLGLPGLYGFGVATLREGAELRSSLGQPGQRERILVFSGASGWTDEKGAFCERHGLTPVIADDQDWAVFVRGGWLDRISYELKFNTGMNRLGLSLNQASLIAKLLRAKPAESHPSGVLSHLAAAENPNIRLSLLQRERFLWLRGQLAPAVPSAHFHLGNSAAIWNQKNWGLKDVSDVVRPGLSLYGVAPWDKAPQRGVTPVCALRASVLAVHLLKPGESIGYGGAFSVTGTKPVYAAILGAGYADGISRRMSGGLAVGPGLAPPEARRGTRKGARRESAQLEREERGGGGYVWLGGRERRFLGIVSMDLCAVTCDADTRVGDWGEIYGPHVDLWAQARAASTIPYELLTSISARVQRIYD